MKKIFGLLFLIFTCSFLSAQQGAVSGVARAGYQSNAKRFGIGVEGRYEVADNIRLAPDVTFFFPKAKTWGVDIDANVQYTFKNVLENLTVYPFAGLNMSNNRNSGGDGFDGYGLTRFGFNLGGGAEYRLTKNDFFSFDMKVTFAEETFGQFMFGYGIYF